MNHLRDRRNKLPPIMSAETLELLKDSFSTEELEKLRSVSEKIYGETSSKTMKWVAEGAHHIIKQSSGVFVKMTCGEVHHFDTAQPEVETVTVQGVQVYPGAITLAKSKHDVVKLLNAMLGGKWRFYCNTGRNPQEFMTIEPRGKITMTAIRDRVFIPNAWDTYGRHMPTWFGVYLKSE